MLGSADVTSHSVYFTLKVGCGSVIYFQSECHYSIPRLAVINMLLQARQFLNENVAINIVRGRNKPTCPGDIKAGC